MKGIRMKVKIFVLLMAVVVCSACVGQHNPYRHDIGGTATTFRADLDKASLVQVLPDDGSLRELLLGPNVKKIVVGFVPDERFNGFYTVAGYEISYKMVLIQSTWWGEAPPMESVVLNSTEDAYRLADPYTPVLVMMGGSNTTAVTVDGNVVLIEGKDMTEKNRFYTDLDLAVDRMLLALLKV